MEDKSMVDGPWLYPNLQLATTNFGPWTFNSQMTHRLGTIILSLRINDTNQYPMIRKLKSGEYRLYSRKKNPKTKRRKNLGTFKSLDAAKKHERDIQYFKRH